MCGIIGSYLESGHPKNTDDEFAKSLNNLRHRGPDYQDFISIKNKGYNLRLGHTRLSIIDLSIDGNQPMESSNGRLIMIYNGEIYNYKELRSELISKGYKFNSDSDSEVLLEAWSEWGVNILNKIIGMFAFAIYDKKDSSITLVRDSFGIKPLYFSNNLNSFCFASELQVLLTLEGGGRKINEQRVYDYLVNGIQDRGYETFIKNINHLPPGHFLKINLNDLSSVIKEKWWEANLNLSNNLSFKDAAENLRELFLQSIKLHLRSDVPLGVALSGGIDSSAITCCVKYLEPDMDLHTFSYIANDSDISEEYYIDIINNYTNAIDHKVYINSNEIEEDVEDLILTQGEPFCTTSMYAQYRIFSKARNSGIKVVLEGQGADEILAGYHGYQGQRMRSLFEEGKYLEMYNFSKNWSKWPGREKYSPWRAFIGQLLPDELHFFINKFLNINPPPNWIYDSNVKKFGINKNSYRLKKNPNAKGRRVIEVLSQAISFGGLPSLLRYGDRNAMRFSIENRVPFLTIPIVEFLFSLPEDYLIGKNGETKMIFREAMRGIVPDILLDRKDKIGFETPIGQLISNLMRNLKVSDKLKRDINILNIKSANNQFKKISNFPSLAKEEDWRLLNLNLWINNTLY